MIALISALWILGMRASKVELQLMFDHANEKTTRDIISVAMHRKTFLFCSGVSVEI